LESQPPVKATDFVAQSVVMLKIARVFEGNFLTGIAIAYWKLPSNGFLWKSG
jgi:hypothetical protein